MRTRKRLNSDLDKQILLFCVKPKTVNDISVEFDFKSTKISKLMTALVIENKVVMKKISGNGALRNVYVNADTAEHFEFNVPIFDASALPAHDPFGLAQGARNAR